MRDWRSPSQRALFFGTPKRNRRYVWTAIRHADLLMGERQPFRHVPYFFSDVFDLSYEFWGDTSGADSVVTRGDITTKSFSVWWLRGQRLVAAFVMNRGDDERTAAPQWIESKRPVDGRELQDASRELS